MKTIVPFLVLLVLAVVCTLLFTDFILRAGDERAGTITILATVRPHRIILVNQNLVIQEIISNTRDDVRPLVYLNTVDGQELPYSDSIIKEYQSLKSSLDFSKPGVLYKQDNRPIRGFIKHIIDRFI